MSRCPAEKESKHKSHHDKTRRVMQVEPKLYSQDRGPKPSDFMPCTTSSGQISRTVVLNINKNNDSNNNNDKHNNDNNNSDDNERGRESCNFRRPGKCRPQARNLKSSNPSTKPSTINRPLGNPVGNHRKHGQSSGLCQAFSCTGTHIHRIWIFLLLAESARDPDVLKLGCP